MNTKMSDPLRCFALLAFVVAGSSPAEARECGSLLLHADGTYEYAYNWEYGGTAPDWGAFAECYDGPAEVCGISLDLTTTSWSYAVGDFYFWADAGGVPGEVLAHLVDVNLGFPAPWPNWMRYWVDFEAPHVVEGRYWVGFWQMAPLHFVCADLNGPGGGCPSIKIPPGYGYPSGWQDVSVIWGPTPALGLGAQVLGPTETRETSWGRVKALYGSGWR